VLNTSKEGYFSISTYSDELCCRRLGSDVQSAFCFLEACPTSGAGVFSCLDGAGAVRAADAGEILVVERVVQDVMFVDIVPHHTRGPVRQGIDLHQLKFFIPLDFAGIGAVFGLVAADSGSPAFKLGQLAAQRFYFS
jgi:hypothetical protein